MLLPARAYAGPRVQLGRLRCCHSTLVPSYIYTQARTCSGRLLSQLWTGPSRHRTRLTLSAHTWHTFIGAPLDPLSWSEQLLVRLGHARHGTEAHLNTHTPFGWVGRKPVAVHPWSEECSSSKASGANQQQQHRYILWLNYLNVWYQLSMCTA